MHVGNELHIYESENEVTIRCRLQFHKYEVRVRLLPKEIEAIKDGNAILIPVKPDSIIWISVDQVSLSGRSSVPFNTIAEMYIKNGDQLLHVIDIRHIEAVNDLRKTKTYELIELLAKKTADKYNIQWAYKYSIDTAEKQKQFYKGLLMVVLLWVVLIIVFILANKT